MIKKYLLLDRKSEYDIVRVPWNIRTRIKKACKIESLDIIQYILNKYVDIRERREISNLCSYYFYINGNAELSFKYNYNVNFILYAAAYMGDVRMIIELNVEDLKSLCVAAGYAAEGGHTDVMLFLTNLCGFEPLDVMLFGASRGGHLDIVKYCLERGAVSIYQAVNCAARKGRLSIIEYLLENTEAIDEEVIWHNVLLETVKLRTTECVKNIIELSMANGNISKEFLRKTMFTAIYYNKLDNLRLLQKYFTVD